MLANIFLPILIFSNLFFNHDYYFYTTVFYASIFCGMYFSRLDYSKNSPRFKLFLAGILFSINLLIFLNQYYFRILSYPSYEKVVYSMAKDIRDHTEENEVILAVGMDWNSILPYYSERYSIMIPTWKKDGKYLPTVRGETLDCAKAFEKIDTLLNGKKVGAIVQCNKYSWDIDPNLKLNKYLSTMGLSKSFENFCYVQYRK